MQVYDFELLAVVKVRNCFCGLRRLRLFSDSAFLELDEVRGSEHVFLERDWSRRDQLVTPAPYDRVDVGATH